MFRGLAHMMGHLRRRSDELDGPVPVLSPEEVASLEDELQALSLLRVPTAARERGWSAVRAEAARRATRPVATARLSRSTVPGRRLRLALVAGLVVVAATLGAVGLVNLKESRQVASTGASQTTVAVTDSTAPTSAVTVTTEPGTSSVTPPVSDGSTVTSSTSAGPSTGTSGQTPTSGNGGAGSGTTGATTKPTTSTTAPTTTSRTVMAKEEKERQALAVVGYLGQAVAAGDRSRAQSLIADSAAFGLSELLASLRNPVSQSVSLLGESSGADVRVILQFVDRVPNESGETQDRVLRFLCTVRTGDDGARVTAIYAAP